MRGQDFITALLTSTVVSSIVSLTIKAIVQAKITHKCNVEIELLKSRHDLEMEKLKTGLALRADSEREMAERRQKAYPRLVELVYRTRNMCRDLASRLGPGKYSMITELSERAKELEAALYEFRIDLERDNKFMGLHQYKNHLLNFCMKLSDVKYFIDHGEHARAEANQADLKSLYEAIETCHGRVITSLSALQQSESVPAGNV